MFSVRFGKFRKIMSVLFKSFSLQNLNRYNLAVLVWYTAMKMINELLLKFNSVNFIIEIIIYISNLILVTAPQGLSNSFHEYLLNHWFAWEIFKRFDTETINPPLIRLQ